MHSYERKTKIRYLLNRRSKKFQNLPVRVFRWVIKNVKKWRKSKIKIFQTLRFGAECPICIILSKETSFPRQNEEIRKLLYLIIITSRNQITSLLSNTQICKFLIVILIIKQTANRAYGLVVDFLGFLFKEI